MDSNSNTKYDVVVIGGGPAGMMTAVEASSHGRSVLLLEKNKSLGKKLAITGGGRCNVTNNRPVVRDMLSRYRDSGKFLFSTFMQHGVKESINWFKERGVIFVEENEGRLFPSNFKAETIRYTLMQELEKSEVAVKLNSPVQAIKYDKKDKSFLITTSLGTVTSKSCVIATGGTSRPETGSTGDGFEWLETLGHTVVSNNMALVPLVINEPWIASLAGVTLPEVKITIFAENKKYSVHKGKLLFTHVGVTGPTVLNLSRSVGELLEDGSVDLRIDLIPNLDAGEAKVKLQELLTEVSNKKIRNIITELLPMAVGKVLLQLSEIDPDKPGHSVTKTERIKLLGLLKSLSLPVKGLLGPDKAVVSAGGVQLDEIDFKTMESRLVPKLYLVGDVLNINRPSGGYSLQLCWSSGSVAGANA